MVNKADTNKARLRCHKRVRGKISGTAERPRLNVFRSSANIYAQIIDDTTGRTLCAASTLDKSFNGYGGNKEAAREVGKMIAQKGSRKKASPTWSSTAAVISSTAASKSWPKAPARAASTSKQGGNDFG